MPSIVGTWKLLHTTARDAADTARPAPYGGKALGRVTFTADGRMMSVVCDGRKELPAGVAGEYSSYCGNYTYDGEKLVTRPIGRGDVEHHHKQRHPAGGGVRGPQLSENIGSGCELYSPRREGTG